MQIEKLRGAQCESHGDHRIAMVLAVAGLCAQGKDASFRFRMYSSLFSWVGGAARENHRVRTCY